MLNSNPHNSDPRNHAVPVIERLRLPEDKDKEILVMALLRVWHEPEFVTIGEGVDFFKQVFEVRSPMIVL